MSPSATHTVPDSPLIVDGAVKRYGAIEALAGVSLTLRSGELVGLLGPNGAGKTTLINAIAGRVRLDAGTVRLFGRALALVPRREQHEAARLVHLPAGPAEAAGDASVEADDVAGGALPGDDLLDLAQLAVHVLERRALGTPWARRL